MTDTPIPTELAPHGVLQRLLFVTGPAGAGRSSAFRALEDMSYEVIDNLPLSLIPRLLDGPRSGSALALGIDTRNREFSTARLGELLDELELRPDVVHELLYLDCQTDILLRRYSETRRRHPLAPHESPAEGIARDFSLLAPIRERADVLIDTSDLSVHDLKAEMSRQFELEATSRLGVSVHSFSYKRGLPRALDLVFDCRFLRNPHWDSDLRPLDGRDARVVDYISQDDRFVPFFEKVRDLTELILPASVDEGKAHLSIGFGCTGGQHRSVAMTEAMAKALAGAGWRVSIRHREIERRSGGVNGDNTGR